MEKWEEKLNRKLSPAREKISNKNQNQLITSAGLKKSGTDNSDQSTMDLSFFNRVYSIVFPQIKILTPGGEPCPKELEMVFLDYLLRADGSPVGNNWVSLSEIPHGEFYFRAFRNYSSKRLPRAFGSDLEQFKTVCKKLEGKPLSFGDAGYWFRALPRVKIAVVYWLGGEEFPNKSNLLFEKSSGNYLSIEGLAQLGRIFCDRLIQLNVNTTTNENSDNR